MNCAANRSGVRSLASDGKTTTFASGEDMRRAISDLEVEIGAGKVRAAVARTGKGW